ncbi:hypothetical protein Clacol_001699 [Clathrus columnatus]|uniref:Uncharacterized protein n=1 Tax=Clathrus columnatus TaxID=1419009 RepID=A0AAV5A239_9AGAM|nr:hypothetical protein Clacol_001699 [Clathrus columnatus]
MSTEISKEKDREQGSIDEKRPSSELSYDIEDGDEALRLVGTLRTAYFSEEYNAKLRRKLTRPPSIMLVWEFPTMYLSQKTRIAKYLGEIPYRLLKCISLTRFIGVNVVLWGIILTLHAAPTGFAGFFVLRFLLGQSNLLVLCHERYDSSIWRVHCIWNCWLSNSSSLLIIPDGACHWQSFTNSPALPPYRVLYILLGGLAILVGICVLIWLPDSPVHAGFLTKEERIAALERVRDDQGGTENKQFKKEQNFGYTSRQTLILATPAGLVGAVMTLLCGYYSDKKVPTIVGSALLVGLNGSHQKVTINSVTLIAFALGNIAGAETFQPKDAPGYLPGKIAILVLLSAQIFISLILRWINIHLNRKKLRVLEEEKARRGWTDEDVEKERQRHAFLDMTDRQKMEHAEAHSLSAKNLNHPRFQKQDNGRVLEYLRDQKRRLKSLKLPEELLEHETVSKFIIPGTGFSSPMLRPRVELHTAQNPTYETEVNVNKARPHSRTQSHRREEATADPFCESLRIQKLHHSKVSQTGSGLEARRAKRKARREIMKGEPPATEKLPKPISVNTYSELSLLQKFPPPNIKRGRLTLKPTSNPGFFSKGKTSIQIRTPSGPVSSNTCRNDMLNRHSMEKNLSPPPSITNQVTTTLEVKDLEKSNNFAQITSTSKAKNYEQSTISELVVPCGATTQPSRNIRSSSPVAPRPLRTYSDVWDIELDKSLPSDAPSIQYASSRVQKNTTFQEDAGSRTLPPFRGQCDVQETYPDSDVICFSPPFEVDFMEKEPYDNTFRWRPYPQIAQQPLYQGSRLDTAYFHEKIDTDCYLARNPLLNNLEIDLTEDDGIIREKYIQSAEQYGMGTFEQEEFERNESNQSMPQLSSQPEVDEHNYWEKISENPPFFGVESQLGDYDYDDNLALDLYAEQDSFSYSSGYYENNMSIHTVKNAERGNEFEVDAETDLGVMERPLFTAQTREFEPVTDWNHNPVEHYSFVGGSNLWSPEKELERLLRNHWLPQKL